MTARFVILHHRLKDGEHWDLMLEKDDRLATWQLPRPLTGPADLPMSARRIGDHRIDYLTYEGPISGDRGSVVQHDCGVYEPIEITESEWRIRLIGHRTQLGLSVRALSGGEWELGPIV